MPTVAHKSLTTANIHIPYAFSYADEAAREGATGMASTDVGKLARQLDDNSLWMLTDDSPVTWQKIGSNEEPVPGPLAIQVFTSSGTYTPTGTVAIVECVGGGGPGGTGGGSFSGAGGGSGGYAKKLIDLTGIVPVAVTVGAGGTTGAGGTSSFGAYCSATGGQPGAGNVSGAQGGVGGTATGGDINIAGGKGTTIYSYTDSGDGADGPWGGGGPGGRSGTPVSGSAPGAGGGGGNTSGAGAAGAAGIVIITEY